MEPSSRRITAVVRRMIGARAYNFATVSPGTDLRPAQQRCQSLFFQHTVIFAFIRRFFGPV